MCEGGTRRAAFTSSVLSWHELTIAYSNIFRLRFVSERADSGETLMAVAIPEKTGD